MNTNSSALLERITNSALWAAYGDALGFASEMVDRSGLIQRTGLETVGETRPWQYRAGGRYGVVVKLPAGTYSDDTQLRLSTCRALGAGAKFDVDSFAKVELPVFLSYGLGAGKGTKASAANLIRDNISWFANFHSSADGNYIDGGGNGAAMRVQPHVWAASYRPDRNDISLNVVRNTICTHGHPRALVGALFHAYQLLRVLMSGDVPGPDAWAEDLGALESLPNIIMEDDYLGRMWLPEWERRTRGTFSQAFIAAIVECKEYLTLFGEVLSSADSPEKTYTVYLERIGGFDSKTRGSGTKTALLASGLAWLHREMSPDIPLKVSANALGSDTDTIATLAGALLGAAFTHAPTGELLDRKVLTFEAGRMHDIAIGLKVDPFPYPSLLEWNPPRTGVDAYGRFNGGFAVAGLGPVKLIAGEELTSKDTVWRWAITETGQTLLVKSRPVVGQIEPGQISPFFARGEKVTSATSLPAPTRARAPVAEPSRGERSKATPRGERPDPAQASLFAQDEVKRNLIRGRSIDEWIAAVEKSGFAPAIIGSAMLEIADASEGVERASAFGAAFAHLRRSLRYKTANVTNRSTMADNYYMALRNMEAKGEKGATYLHSAVCAKLGIDPRGPHGEGFLIMSQLFDEKHIEQVQQVSRDAATQQPWTDWLVRSR